MADMTFSKGSSMTVDTVKALVDARVKEAIDEGSRRPRQEIAEPQEWWNIWATGPFQVVAPGGPLQPHKVIKIGEKFYIAVVIWFSPLIMTPGGPSVCDLITNLGCRIRIDCCTIDLCRVVSAGQFNCDNVLIDLVPGQCYYTYVFEYTANPGTESCLYEQNICVRVIGCPTNAAPQLAGFASAVFDFDPDLFYPTVPPPVPVTPPVPTPTPPTPAPGRPPGWRFMEGIRFMIYP
jgi:hypothetical protein